MNITKMKAGIYRKYGNPSEVLSVQEIQKPKPKPNEILVKVKATTVNRTDEGIVTARYVVSRLFSGLFKPKKQVTGTDFAGRIEAIGELVSSFEVGQDVFGFNDEGLCSHAEYLCIDVAKTVLIMPKQLSYAEAVASLEGMHYAKNFINKVKLKEGQQVLVNGASGAIGSAAVQLLKSINLEVTAVCDTHCIDKIKAIGADHVIDYTITDFTKMHHTYDFVFDAVGKSTFSKCKPILKKAGVYISSELGPFGSNIYFSLLTPIFSRKKVKFPMPSDIKGSMHFVTKLISDGKFAPVIDRSYSLDELVAAFQYVQKGYKVGNVIIEME